MASDLFVDSIAWLNMPIGPANQCGPPKWFQKNAAGINVIDKRKIAEPINATNALLLKDEIKIPLTSAKRRLTIKVSITRPHSAIVTPPSQRGKARIGSAESNAVKDLM